MNAQLFLAPIIDEQINLANFSILYINKKA